MQPYDPYVAVSQALQLYFDGLYDGDVEKLKQIFHPSCTLYSAPEGKFGSIALDHYFESIKNRPSPRSAGQIRMDCILSLTVNNEGAAFALSKTARTPRLYNEFLTLLLVEGRWQIISKVYSWVNVDV